jgi:hypothetical protein
MKRILVLLVVAFAAAFVSGCGVSNVPVTITNDLGAWNIEEVYVDLSDDPWGENRITEVMEQADVTTITVPAGTYDIKVVDEDGDSYTRSDIEIGAEGYSWAVTLSDID